jgi:hypothetical protein
MNGLPYPRSFRDRHRFVFIMQTLLKALLPVLACALPAQSLTTTFAAGNGQSGNMFDIVGVQPVIVTGLDLHLAPGTWNLELYTVTAGTTFVGNETNSAAWTLVGAAPNVVSAGTGIGTPLPLTFALPIAAGQQLGFYVTITNGTSMNYTNGTAVGNVFTSDPFIQILEGSGNPYPFGAPFTPRVWNGTVYYAPSGGGIFATNASLGAGCGQESSSFYEFWSSANFDLANTTLTFLNTGSGYTVVNSIAGTILPPSGTAQNVAPGQLDGEQLFTLSSAMPIPGGTTSQLNVCTKGYIAAAPGNLIDFTPTGPELVAFPQLTWACWHDYDQTSVGSGLIQYEEVAGTVYVTWNGVNSYLTTTPNTFQFQFQLATGNVTLVMGAFSGAASIDNIVVGYSPAGANLDPGAIDISATPTIIVGAADIPALGLVGVTRPIINTSWNLNVINVPANGVFGVDIVGLTDPAINDLAFLGLPGCGLRASLDVLQTWVVAGATHARSLALPNNTAFIGVQLFATSAVFQAPPINAFGAITSNGIRGSVGNL